MGRHPDIAKGYAVFRRLDFIPPVVTVRSGCFGENSISRPTPQGLGMNARVEAIWPTDRILGDDMKFILSSDDSFAYIVLSARFIPTNNADLLRKTRCVAHPQG